MERMQMSDLCDDCLFSDKPSVCSLCFGGNNYVTRTNSGPVQISLEEYKEVFRYHKWIEMFTTSHVYNITKKLMEDKLTNAQLRIMERIHRTVVKTRSLLHEQLYGKGHTLEEYLCPEDEYYYFKYRDVMYMIHKHRFQLYVKALLDWNDLRSLVVL